MGDHERGLPTAPSNNPSDGLLFGLPPVLRVDGFHVRIFPNDHPPAHVHVFKAGAAIVIELGTVSKPVWIREIAGMTRADVAIAVMLVDDHHLVLRQQWEKIHGET